MNGESNSAAIETAIDDFDDRRRKGAQRRCDSGELLTRPIAGGGVEDDRGVEASSPGLGGVCVGQSDLVGGNGALAVRPKPGYSHPLPFTRFD